MSRFGLCNYDMDSDELKVENFKEFPCYEAAFGYYLHLIREEKLFPFTWDKTLWIVWIEGDYIVQFLHLSEEIKCRIVSLKED